MYIDDTPKLRRQILKNAGAFVPGRKTFWSWQGVADAVAITVTGAADAFVIEGAGDPVRVVVTKRALNCPNCGAGCYKIVHNGETWGCRLCCGLKYRTRTWQHPRVARRSTRHRLARADPGSLSEQKLRRKLDRVNDRIRRSASRVGFRCTRPDRGGSGTF